MSAVDWSKLTPRQVVDALAAAPKVLGPWMLTERFGNVRIYGPGLGIWSRHPASLNAGASWNSPCCVQPFTPGPGWGASIRYDWYADGFATADEAKRACDEQLRTMGYVLDEEEPSDG